MKNLKQLLKKSNEQLVAALGKEEYMYSSHVLKILLEEWEEWDDNADRLVSDIQYVVVIDGKKAIYDDKRINIKRLLRALDVYSEDPRVLLKNLGVNAAQRRSNLELFGLAKEASAQGLNHLYHAMKWYWYSCESASTRVLADSFVATALPAAYNSFIGIQPGSVPVSPIKALGENYINY